MPPMAAQTSGLDCCFDNEPVWLAVIAGSRNSRSPNKNLQLVAYAMPSLDISQRQFDTAKNSEPDSLTIGIAVYTVLSNAIPTQRLLIYKEH